VEFEASRTRAGLAGVGVLTSLAAAWAVASADESTVFIAGRGLHWVCPFRHLFGVPCPSCGMTRSVVMTFGGNWRVALALNPGGPLLVLGALLFGAWLLFRALRPPADGVVTTRGLAPWAYAYGAAVLGVMLVHWVRALV
jgi:hypothetical protein